MCCSRHFGFEHARPVRRPGCVSVPQYHVFFDYGWYWALSRKAVLEVRANSKAQSDIQPIDLFTVFAAILASRQSDSK